MKHKLRKVLFYYKKEEKSKSYRIYNVSLLPFKAKSVDE